MPRFVIAICASIVAAGVLTGFARVMEAAAPHTAPQAPLLALTETVEARPTETPPPTTPPETPVQEQQQTATPTETAVSTETPALTPTPTALVPATLPTTGASVASGAPLILLVLALIAAVGGLMAHSRRV